MKKTKEIVPRETTTEKEVVKKVDIIVFEDGYVIVQVLNKEGIDYTRKAQKIGDRVRNAIKALAKEGYAIKLVNIEEPKQSEIPFYTEGTNQ